jgi:N-methylhydantoinase A/oxoprolinase/acetone carboxylase beta subunit
MVATYWVGVEATGVMTKPTLLRAPFRTRTKFVPAPRLTVYFEAKPIEAVPVYAGVDLRGGDHVAGRGIVEYSGNTIVVHPGRTLSVEDDSNLKFEFGGRA